LMLLRFIDSEYCLVSVLSLKVDNPSSTGESSNAKKNSKWPKMVQVDQVARAVRAELYWMWVIISIASNSPVTVFVTAI